MMEFFLTADMTPKVIPNSEAIMMAHKASSIVAGKREKISLATGFLV